MITTILHSLTAAAFFTVIFVTEIAVLLRHDLPDPQAEREFGQSLNFFLGALAGIVIFVGFSKLFP